MKSPIASASSLIVLLSAPIVFAQEPTPPPRAAGRPSVRSLFNRNAPETPSPTAEVAPATPEVKTDARVFPASSRLPEPTSPDELKPATIAMTNEPIEPWLLTKDAGPFMVLAKSFRGPQAERLALALAKELRHDYGLPTYILRTKDFAGKSMIRNVPPTATEAQRQAILTAPEKDRSLDEAAVLVGNEKSLEDSLTLMHKVKKIKPRCLDEMPTLFGWRKGQGLSTALRTTNPYVPAQNLYPGRKAGDKLVAQMNSGPRSIYNCPGRYTIQVAEFGGRAVFNPSEKDASLFDGSWLKKSPLMTAADDAEQLAENLSRDPEIQRTGAQPYVYHDRTSSKVLIGSFQDPKDPSASKLHETLLKVTYSLTQKTKGLMFAPANYLTDLEDPNHPIKAMK